MIRRRVIAATFTVAWVLTPAFCQRGTDWHDPSPHRVEFVTVEPGVKLEVLDWGGTGQPVVLLAGYNTAHIYDNLAEKLSKFCHVYGITRRGLGASSRPDKGYSAQRSAEDVLQVLDNLKIVKPVLAGHSVGGQDLNVIGAQHSERLAGLVYLNSGEDGTLGHKIWSIIGIDSAAVDTARKNLPAEMQKAPPSPDYASFPAYQRWEKRVHGASMPEAELRQLYATNPDGSVGIYRTPMTVKDAIFKGLQKPEYAGIHVPALAFFAMPATASEQIQRYRPQSAEERAAIERVQSADLAITQEHIQELRNGIANIHIVELPKANYYVWLTNKGDIVREMRAFLLSIHKK